MCVGEGRGGGTSGNFKRDDKINDKFLEQAWNNTAFFSKVPRPRLLLSGVLTVNNCQLIIIITLGQIACDNKNSGAVV